MKKTITFFIAVLLIIFSYGQQGIAVYPTNWWVNMKWNKLQLMIHAPGVGNNGVRMQAYAGVHIISVEPAENRNYLFVNMVIEKTAQPGKLRFYKDDGGHTGPNPVLFEYELKPRRSGNGISYAQGVTSSDFIYFLMPDRFSNGDASNDRVAGMRDQSLNRDSIYDRHGGDLQGVINHLDYMQSLGATTLWMTPVLENDMPYRTEHGYAFTDHYSIEPRIGGAAAYKKLSDELHKRGMKLIQDAVYNHVGSYHFTFTDKPMHDWYHEWPSYTQTNYRDQVWMDTHAAVADKKKMGDGWFTHQMPDLNQSNPYVANFLIQHAIWCVEEFGVDGWRIDTYIYNDPVFMNRCNKALTDEYPKMTMFGETWVHGTANQAYFVQNNMNVPFKSNLQGATDFQCNFYGIVPALTQNFGWTEGVNKLYMTLSNDFLYKDPMQNVIFLDNHDMSRFFSQVGEDVAKQKMGLSWLFTCRGIPQLYYGTEILMKGISNPDGWVRLDFPGGWNGDSKNAFTGAGLTNDEKAVQELTRRLGNFRQHSSAIKTGKLMQYIPEDGVYVYFRYDNKQTVMCVMNQGDNEKTIDLSRFSERMNGFTKAFDVAGGNEFILDRNLTIKGKFLLVMELRK